MIYGHDKTGHELKYVLRLLPNSNRPISSVQSKEIRAHLAALRGIKIRLGKHGEEDDNCGVPDHDVNCRCIDRGGPHRLRES